MSKTTMTAEQAKYFKNNPKEDKLFFLSNGLCVRTADAAANQAAKLKAKGKSDEVVEYTREEYEAYLEAQKTDAGAGESEKQSESEGSAKEQALVAATEKLDAARAALKLAQEKQAAVKEDAKPATKTTAAKKVADAEAAVAEAEAAWNAAKAAMEPAAE